MYAPTLQLPRALVFKILNKSKPEHIWMRLKTPDAGTLLSFCQVESTLWEQPSRNVAMEGRWGHPSVNQTPTHVEGTWLSLNSWRLPVPAKQLQGRQRKRREWSGQCTIENNVVENEIYGSVQAPRDFSSEETEGPKLRRSRKHLLYRINWSSGFKISSVQVVLSLSAVVGFLHAQTPNGGRGPPATPAPSCPRLHRDRRQKSISETGELFMSWWEKRALAPTNP